MSDLKHRLLSLALIALLVQATLPYLLTNCPVMNGGETTISAAHKMMPADCPMLAITHKASVDKPASPPVKQSSDLTCPLCAVMSPLHAFIVAGLIALPPPGDLTAKQVYTTMLARIDRQPPTASFSARAPPAFS